jgi:hypothetical protein
VSIGGRNAPGAEAAVGALGAIGALVVASMDSSNHASAVGDARSSAPFRFHGPVTAALRIATTDAQGDRVATALEADAQADIRVTPRMRLILDDTDAARAFVEMSARFKDAETGADRAKWYSFTDPVTRPLRSDGTGWFDNDAQALRRTTDESFRRLARLMADDLSGRWATLQGSETAPRLAVRSRFTRQEATLIVLETLPNGWIVSSLLQQVLNAASTRGRAGAGGGVLPDGGVEGRARTRSTTSPGGASRDRSS